MNTSTAVRVYIGNDGTSPTVKVLSVETTATFQYNSASYRQLSATTGGTADADGTFAFSITYELTQTGSFGSIVDNKVAYGTYNPTTGVGNLN
jgi:hypothetical protein